MISPNLKRYGFLLIVKFSKFITINLQSHPGGSIINFYAASNATEAFNEFHYRSEKAKKTLASLPSRPLGSQDSNIKERSRSTLLGDFAKLRADFEKVWISEKQLVV